MAVGSAVRRSSSGGTSYRRGRTRTRIRCRRSGAASTARNRRPRHAPTGRASHCLSAWLRSGKAAMSVAAWAATRRRAVRESPTTSSRLTVATSFHPTVCAMRAPRRALRSSVAWVAWISGTTDLTSTTSRARSGRRRARTSTDPRSPSRLKVTSGRASHPSASSRCLDRRRVRGIQQSIELFAVPLKAHVDRSAELGGQPFQVAQAQAPNVAALGLRDRRSTESRCLGEVDLSPLASTAEGAQRQADADAVHASIIDRSP